MAAYFIESSAFVKRFAPEVGSRFVLDLLRPSAMNRLYAATITQVEVCSALARRNKGGSLSFDQLNKSLRRLYRDFPVRFVQIAVNDAVIAGALRLAQTYGLRGYDSIQLSAALEANRKRLNLNLPPLTLISSDGEINTAAQAENLLFQVPT
jgi:uncharacterized protein